MTDALAKAREALAIRFAIRDWATAAQNRTVDAIEALIAAKLAALHPATPEATGDAKDQREGAELAQFLTDALGDRRGAGWFQEGPNVHVWGRTGSDELAVHVTYIDDKAKDHRITDLECDLVECKEANIAKDQRIAELERERERLQTENDWLTECNDRANVRADCANDLAEKAEAELASLRGRVKKACGHVENGVRLVEGAWIESTPLRDALALLTDPATATEEEKGGDPHRRRSDAHPEGSPRSGGIAQPARAPTEPVPAPSPAFKAMMEALGPLEGLANAIGPWADGHTVLICMRVCRVGREALRLARAEMGGA